MLFSVYTLSKKTSHHCSIVTIFGITVAEKVGSQKCTLFSHLTILVLLHYLGKQETRKLGLFHLNATCFFTKKHKTV